MKVCQKIKIGTEHTKNNSEMANIKQNDKLVNVTDHRLFETRLTLRFALLAYVEDTVNGITSFRFSNIHPNNYSSL